MKKKSLRVHSKEPYALSRVKKTKQTKKCTYRN